MQAFMIEVTQNETTRWINAAQIKTVDRLDGGAAIRLMDGEVYCVQESAVELVARMNGTLSKDGFVRSFNLAESEA